MGKETSGEKADHCRQDSNSYQSIVNYQRLPVFVIGYGKLPSEIKLGLLQYIDRGEIEDERDILYHIFKYS